MRLPHRRRREEVVWAWRWPRFGAFGQKDVFDFASSVCCRQWCVFFFLVFVFFLPCVWHLFLGKRSAALPWRCYGGRGDLFLVLSSNCPAWRLLHGFFRLVFTIVRIKTRGGDLFFVFVGIRIRCRAILCLYRGGVRRWGSTDRCRGGRRKHRGAGGGRENAVRRERGDLGRLWSMMRLPTAVSWTRRPFTPRQTVLLLLLLLLVDCLCAVLGTGRRAKGCGPLPFMVHSLHSFPFACGTEGGGHGAGGGGGGGSRCLLISSRWVALAFHWGGRWTSAVVEKPHRGWGGGKRRRRHRHHCRSAGRGRHTGVLLLHLHLAPSMFHCPIPASVAEQHVMGVRLRDECFLCHLAGVPHAAGKGTGRRKRRGRRRRRRDLRSRVGRWTFV